MPGLKSVKMPARQSQHQESLKAKGNRAASYTGNGPPPAAGQAMGEGMKASSIPAHK